MNELDFVTWWFDKHYILSTLFTPLFSFIWACYKGLLLRGIIALILIPIPGAKLRLKR